MENYKILFAIYGFMFGAILGSFLGVVHYRIPLGKSIITPGSYCDNCKKPLKWYDNIPILGYLFLRGKCRFCKSEIPIRNFLFELVLGILFAVIAFILF